MDYHKDINMWPLLLICMPFLSLHRTYELELRLDDPKSKEDDMGVVMVDVCLMFRDATIKRSPVRVFLIWEAFVDAVLCPYSSLFVLIHVNFLFSKRWPQRKNKVWIFISLYLLLNVNCIQNAFTIPKFNFVISMVALTVILIWNTRGQ